MEFDDEQIADDKSVTQMNLHYSGVSPHSVKVFEEKFSHNFLVVGKLIKKTEKLLDFEAKMHFGELKNFFEDLKTINSLELDALKKAYSLDDLNTQTPEMLKEPANFSELDKNLAKNEILILQKLLEGFFEENDEKNKNLLKKMIFRRFESLIATFFGQQI